MTRSGRHGGRAPGQRPLRVGELLRHALSEILERGGLREPELDGVSLTVTEVRVTPDIRTATVYVTPLGGAGAEAALAGLRRATPYLRARLGREVSLRYVPDLRFERDETFEAAEAIDRLLKSPEVSRDLGGTAPDEC